MRSSLLVVLIATAWAMSTADSVAQKAERPPYLGVTGSYQAGGSKGGSQGHCNACVLFHNDRPLVCFGLNQRPKQKARYTYIILFKTGPEKITSTGVSGKISGTLDRADEAFDISLGKKVVKVAHKFTTDEKTGTVASESLKVGDTEVKPDSPRVFLVDLTQPKLVYRPVKVDLPTEVPEFPKKSDESWGPVVLRAVNQLKEKSPEVKKFLEPPAPPK